jgi:hypothetical protein
MNTNFENYLIMEVEKQGMVKRVNICDGTHSGYEPQCTMELKDPGRFSLNSLVGTLSGKAALHQFKKGDLVAVKLWIWKYKHHGEFVNHIYIKDIKLVKELDHLFL